MKRRAPRSAVYNKPVTDVLRGKGWHAVYEDAVLVVVHKGPKLLSVPDAGDAPALSTLLDHALKSRDGQSVAAYPVHRLDRDVSGLVVFAKTKAVRDALMAQFRDGRAHRTYQAVVAGRPDDIEGTIRRRLDTRGPKGRARGRGRDVPAVTHWRVLRFGTHATLVEAVLETGRKNQIRAHFAALGLPLLGDRAYGGPERDGFSRRRIALHGGRLELEHPLSGQRLVFEDPLPPTFERPFL